MAGRAGKPTRKQKEQMLALEKARKSAQMRANKTGQPVRFGNETSQGFALPQKPKAPKLTVDPETRAKRKAEREQRKAEREQRIAARQAARQALTPKERMQKRKSAQEARRAKKAAPTTAPTTAPTPKPTLIPTKPTPKPTPMRTKPTPRPSTPYIMNPNPIGKQKIVTLNTGPMARRVSSNATGKILGSMFSTGGVATKKAKGSNDYRKSGTTLSTTDNRKKT